MSFSNRSMIACFYPRDPCGPRPEGVDQLSDHVAVSIRATRAGRDLGRAWAGQSGGKFLSARPVRAATRARRPPTWRPTRFYPRDPCGPRQSSSPISTSITAFLSARPVRAATVIPYPPPPTLTSFYPRDPCGPRREPWKYMSSVDFVSIRATRAGRDAQIVSGLVMPC